MKQIYGHTGGLKAKQLHRLQNFYRRRVQPRQLVSAELARDMCLLAGEMDRQVALLIDRPGRITHVIVGDHQRIVIPDVSNWRRGMGRLKGLRCVHVHLHGEPLTDDDVTDLALLRLDFMVAVTTDDNGYPHRFHAAHLLPENRQGRAYEMLAPLSSGQLDIDFIELLDALEAEIERTTAARRATDGRERALLVSVTTAGKQVARDSLDELTELTRSAGIEVVGTVLQQRTKADPRLLIGRGKLQQLTVAVLQKAATVMIFDQELNASQIRSITNQIDLKVIDRTMLILDIFAQRARSREGKLQVELAQLKYLLPRLVTKNTAMSRLTGGIGGRGPGETKLEINRRRVRQRINRLEATLEQVRRQRRQQKSLRDRRELPVISIVGYTNAGKSTLLNTLTQSSVQAENRLFATLDPSSRRLRFPEEIEVIITDTVGFIRDLPVDLMVAFRATLEELENADLLLHVADAGNPRVLEQIEAVEGILHDLGLGRIPVIRILNKMDLVDEQQLLHQCRRLEAIAISALDRATLEPLTVEMQKRIKPLRTIKSAVSGESDPEAISS